MSCRMLLCMTSITVDYSFLLGVVLELWHKLGINFKVGKVFRLGFAQ